MMGSITPSESTVSTTNTDYSGKFTIHPLLYVCSFDDDFLTENDSGFNVVPITGDFLKKMRATDNNRRLLEPRLRYTSGCPKSLMRFLFT